jgi:hypothetical protein
MKTTRWIPLLLTGLFSMPVFAQTAANDTQRNVNQENRIEAGLQSGALTTHEAAKLEKEESNIDRAEANALKDGRLNPGEKQRITAMQNKASHDISVDTHNGQRGNPDSASSKRIQADVQRDIHQQQRIENGVKDGSLTHHEAAKLERGESHIDRREAAAGRDGHIGAHEQAGIDRAQNRESGKIYRQRHDGQKRHESRNS